ncbi:ABC transporter [Actinomadura cremea]|nr:ABC transporter [Actinomadura cremea]
MTMTTVSRRGGFMGAVAFEWTKFKSVRGTWWNFAMGLLLTLGFAAVVGSSAAASAAKGVDVTAPAPHHVSQVFLISQLTVVVLATLALTSEYSSGSIRTTLQSVPVRGRMLASKTLVVAVAAGVAGFVFSVLATLVAAPMMGDPGDYSAGELLGTALSAGLYLASLAVMCVGLGAVLRSAAGTITTLILVLLAVPQLLGFVGSPWLETFADYMPSEAGAAMMTGADDPYGAATAVPVLALWAIASFTAGLVVLRRRDATV